MNSQVPSVLIGITTRNRGEILSKAITSAKQQDYPYTRIMVIDDASTDGTPLLQRDFPDIEWVVHNPPRGYRENRNQMMQADGIEYFVSLDDDAWFLKNDEISIAVARMEANADLAAIAFDILSPTDSEIQLRTTPYEGITFIGCGHLLRISAVKIAGWYEATPGPYGAEEKDLSIRLMNLGFRINFLPGVHVWHDKAWTGRDWGPLHKSGVCNDLVMATRRCPFPDLFFVLPYKVLSHIRFALRKPALLASTFRGLLLFARHLGASLATRSPVRRSVFWKAVQSRKVRCRF
jgi:GT2 family glycosyltransferase